MSDKNDYPLFGPEDWEAPMHFNCRCSMNPFSDKVVQLNMPDVSYQLALQVFGNDILKN